MIKNLRHGFSALAILCSVAALQQGAFADAITTLHSTGYGLGVGAVDPYWTLTGTNPGGYSSSLTVANPTQYPLVSNWAPNDADSQWLVPNNSQGNHASSPSVFYNNTTTFSLAGFDASTASLSFRVATDNVLRDVLLNGVSLKSAAYGLDFTSVNLGSFNTFTINGGPAFNSGTNVLTFRVENQVGGDQNPTGINVKLTGTASKAVPEAGSLALLGSGIALGISVIARRKR